ncbi:hypothetical protein PspLS_11677 [Pyricularia sp. CBS 133598]|nr:hypothetical protein PspLS_11677 [Pyricularia sp. CBS 133598]
MKLSFTLTALAFAATATAAPSKTDAELPNPVAVAPRQISSIGSLLCNPGSYQCRNGNTDIYVCNGSLPEPLLAVMSNIMSGLGVV